MSTSESHLTEHATSDHHHVRSFAAIVTAWYVLLGALWIVVTDVVLYVVHDDRVLAARIDSTMGWVFLGLTAMMMFVITNRAVKRMTRAESLVRAVLDSIADGVLTVDPDHLIASVNPAAARMLGTTPDKLVGLGPEAFTEHYHVTRSDGHTVKPGQLISQRVLAGERPPSYRLRLHPPHRAELVALCTAAPVRVDRAGPVALAVSVIHDVTEIERIEHVRDQFMSAAAHAFRTPVAVIRTQAHLLDPDWASSAAMIERQCGRLSRLIDNIFILVRLRTNSLELHPEQLACAAVIEEVALEMGAAHGQHRLVTAIEARPDVFADRDALAQCVRNAIEVAYRSSVGRTDVFLVLDETESLARVRVTYEPVETTHGIVADAPGYEGLSVERHVIESLVEAMSGTVRASGVGSMWTDWIEVPKVKDDGRF